MVCFSHIVAGGCGHRIPLFSSNLAFDWRPWPFTRLVLLHRSLKFILLISSHSPYTVEQILSGELYTNFVPLSIVAILTNPQLGCPSIHFTGTAGKTDKASISSKFEIGSTHTFLRLVAQASEITTLPWCKHPPVRRKCGIDLRQPSLRESLLVVREHGGDNNGVGGENGLGSIDKRRLSALLVGFYASLFLFGKQGCIE